MGHVLSLNLIDLIIKIRDFLSFRSQQPPLQIENDPSPDSTSKEESISLEYQEVPESIEDKIKRIHSKIGLAPTYLLEEDREANCTEVQRAVFFCMKDYVDRYINHPLDSYFSSPFSVKDILPLAGMPRIYDWKRFCELFEISPDSFRDYLPLNCRKGNDYETYANLTIGSKGVN